MPWDVFIRIFRRQRTIQAQLIDSRNDVGQHAGGISQLRKIASLADMDQVARDRMANGLIPCLYGGALTSNLSVTFRIQEYIGNAPETYKVFPTPTPSNTGSHHPGEAPGLGVEYR